MSYFIVLSGRNASKVHVAIGKLVPIVEAQSYLANLASEIEAADGGPCFFWDDEASGTSEELLISLEESILNSSRHKEHPLFKTLRECERLAVSVRFWTATNDLRAFSHVPQLLNAEEAIAMLHSELMVNPTLGFALHPVQTPKP